MAVSIDEVIADLERHRGIDKPMVGDLRETGLSFEAEAVIHKLRQADRTLKWRRIYQGDSSEVELVDVLDANEIRRRGYVVGNQTLTIAGESPAERDRITYHNTKNPLFEDVWIGEPLI